MNIKIKIFVLSLAFSTVAFSSVKITEKGGVKNYSFSVDGIENSTKDYDGEKFQIIKMIGVDGYEGIKYELGSPEIPAIRLLVKADNISDIKVNSKGLINTQNIILKNDIKPSFESLEKIPGTTFKISKNKHFTSSVAYPEVTYEIVESGSIRGQKQFMISLYPIDYIGNSRSLIIARKFNVTVKEKTVNKTSSKDAGIVFVVGEKFKNSPSLISYTELKQKLGFNVYTIIMPAKASAENTRAKLKDLYKIQKDLQYALIIGDAADIPGKYSNEDFTGLTDHYFSAIDTDNYATDINGPDVAVGRIAVENEVQLATVLRKYTRYINGDFQSNSWLRNASFLATDDRFVVAEGTHNYVINTHTASKGYKGNFPAVNQSGGDKLYAITHGAGQSEVMTNISKGRAIIDYSGHGATTYWDAPRVTQADVRSLNSNASSLPFVISNACITGDYRVAESFAETWQRQEWGAIAFWGSMDSSYWDEDDILERRMFDGIFTLEKKSFGEITHFALSELWLKYGGSGRSAYYWETYHLFGDPSIDLRLK